MPNSRDDKRGVHNLFSWFDVLGSIASTCMYLGVFWCDFPAWLTIVLGSQFATDSIQFQAQETLFKSGWTLHLWTPHVMSWGISNIQTYLKTGPRWLPDGVQIDPTNAEKHVQNLPESFKSKLGVHSQIIEQQFTNKRMNWSRTYN